ncbi:MAG: AsmA family protein [Janthinobacterium lividum]
MQQESEQIGTDHTSEEEASLWTATTRRRVKLGLIGLLCIVLLVVVPPYFSISRYQRRVAVAISGALGRPVHFDNISVHVLPIPGLTITNFVVSENPDFGSEPVLRANSVEARLRVSSLWRRRIEVSRISLDSPSINLVRRHEDGRWNLQGILMQASQMKSAPTAQARAGDAPRFPYIEATDARINIKNGNSKLPFSVKEAEFALWLPEPNQWRLRMVGKPVRTDTDVNDVGLLRVEATLGRAVDLSNAPIDLSASWKPTPLGEAAKLTAGYDLGWRGAGSASATLHGTLGAAKLVTDMHLLGVHRDEFLPEQNVDINAHCEAATAGLLRSLHDVRCAVPTDNSLTFASVVEALRRLPAANPGDDIPATAARPGVLLVRAEVGNVLDWRTASAEATLADAPAEYAAIWARIFLQGIPKQVQLGGTFHLTASTEPAETGPRSWDAMLACDCVLPEPQTGTATPTDATDKASKPTLNRWLLTLHHQDLEGVSGGSASGFSLSAHPEPEHGVDAPEEPAAGDALVAGQISRAGYLLRYPSLAAVQQIAVVLPALAQGVPADANGPLAAGGTWDRPPIWTVGSSTERKPVKRKPHRQR